MMPVNHHPRSDKKICYYRDEGRVFKVRNNGMYLCIASRADTTFQIALEG